MMLADTETLDGMGCEELDEEGWWLPFNDQTIIHRRMIKVPRELSEYEAVIVVLAQVRDDLLHEFWDAEYRKEIHHICQHIRY